MTPRLPLALPCNGILLTALGALLLAAAPAQAQVTTVCASGCDFSSIQAAVTAATPGDIIEVGDGTYAENVTIDKALTLRSANGRAATTIEGSSGLGTVVVEGATTGVTVGGAGQGFTLVGFDGNGAVETGALYIRGSHTTLAVLGNELVADGEHGLIAEYGATLDGVTIDGNTFSGTTYVGAEPGGCGFSTQFNAGNNVPRQLAVLGNGGGDLGTANVTNVTFTNNALTGTAGGATPAAGCEVFGQGNSLATLDVATSTVSGNTFAGTTARFGAALRMRRPGVAVTGNTFTTTGLGLANSIVFAQNNTTAIEAIVAANTFDKGAYAEGGTTVAMSVQGAVNDAAAGGTVEVLPGLYVGQAFIDKDLTLNGAGAAQTTLQAQTTLAECFTTSSAKKPILCVTDGATVDIDGVTLDGAGNGNGNVQFIGLAFRNAGGSLTNAVVKDVRETPFSGSQHGVGIYAYNDDTISRTVAVSNTEVSGFQKNAFALNAGDTTPLVIDVRDNTVTGAGLTSVTAQNGIQAYGRMITGTIADNTVSGIAYDNTANPTKWVASSVLNFWSDVDLTDNTITGAQVGGYWYDGAGTIDGNTIDVITAGNGGMWGIIATDPPAAVPTPFDPPVSAGASGLLAATAASTLVVSVTDNDVTFSGGLNTGAVGIEADAGYGPNDLDVSIANNRLSGFETAVGIFDCTSSCSTGVFTALSVTGNDLAGNDTGLSSNRATVVDAAGNWWGDADPSDDVSGLVDFSPWLGAAPGTAPMTWYTNDSIADAVAAAASGDAIHVLAGTYTESTAIAKSLTLNGAQAGVAVAGRTFADASESVISGLTTVTATDVTLDGFSLTHPDGAYALLLQSSSTDIVVANNRVQDVGTGAPQATTARGPNVHAVYLSNGPDRVTISGNAFRAIRANGRTVSAVGILDSTPGSCSEDVVVSGNTFNDITSLGSNRNWGSYAVIANRCTVDLQVTDNVIDSIQGEWSHAIGLEADTQGSAVVTGNTISNLVRTKVDPDAVAVFFQVNPSGGSVDVSGNAFSGTMDFGVAQHPDAGGVYVVDAEGNWWGDASGPAGEGAGTGVGVAPGVDFDPWIGKAEAQPVTAVNTPTTFTGGSAPATLTFRTLPPGGGTVSVATYPGLPAGVAAPPGTPIAFSIELTSTMTNYDFEVDISIDVSGIAGFGPTTQVGYYNASTGQWVIINGTYDAGPPATYSFTTDHFTPFAFFNTPGTAYDIFVVTDPTDLGTSAAFPNTAWTVTASEPDDWSTNGAPTVDFYIAPEVGSTFFSSSVTLEWDPAVLTYSAADQTGGLYDGANRTFFADASDAATGTLVVDGSRLDVANFTTVATDFLAKLTFTVAAPGNSPVDLTGLRFRAYDGASGQQDVYVTANGGELKAYLGDVGSTGDASTGDGLVDFEDLTLFSGAYWSATGDAAYKVKYDVGPTATNTVYGLPDEDGEVEFEDLVIFSISYGLSNTGAYPRRGETEAEGPREPVAVSVGAARAVDGTVRVPVLIGEVADLRAASIGFRFEDGLFEVVGAARPAEGPFASDTPALHLARATDGGAVADAATFGTTGVSGEGAVLELVLRPTSGLASAYDGAEGLVTLAEARLRSTGNAELPVALAPGALATVPAEFYLAQGYPNPVRGTATLEYGLAEASHVEVTLFDALGRRVTTLVDGEQEAGVHTTTVDAGSLPSGLYLYVIRAGAHTATQRVTVVR